MANPIRLLLADDHAVVRSGLRLLLESQPDMAIIGEAETGEEAVRLTAELSPDVVLMDIEMPGINGIEAARRIKAQSPATAVLALTMYEDDQYFFEMFFKIILKVYSLPVNVIPVIIKFTKLHNLFVKFICSFIPHFNSNNIYIMYRV